MGAVSPLKIKITIPYMSFLRNHYRIYLINLPGPILSLS